MVRVRAMVRVRVRARVGFRVRVSNPSCPAGAINGGASITIPKG